MVKKFRRAAAGIEEQLPSDLRTPQTLSQTCDYLFNEVVAEASELGRVHHFVWDRTRAIRNDFTILQVSSPEDLSCAVNCLERIARFHIVSLHQMAGVKEGEYQYDWQQDREQLDRTLVSLMQYYDDSRGKLPLPNEPEFRAYLIVFQLQDPDLEDRVQSWPQELVQHPRIRKALKLYAAAGNTSHLQGPLRPPVSLPIAQQNWQRFWNLVASSRTSYLTACVAEINFNMIRRTALQALTKSLNQRATADFTTEELCEILAFNDEFQTEEYLLKYDVSFDNRDRERFADISALKTRHTLPESVPGMPKQYKSDMVEVKRFGRSLPAVISGMPFREAQANGMVNEEELVAHDEAMDDGMGEPQGSGFGSGDAEPVNDGESLFMPDTANTKPQGSVDFDTPPTSMFGQAKEQPQASAFSFGKPSNGTFGSASGATSTFGQASNEPAATEKPKSFNFLGSGASNTNNASAFNPAPTPSSNGFGFGKPASTTPAQSPFAGAGFGDAAKKESSAPGSGGFNFGNASNSAPSASAALFPPPTKPNPFIEEADEPSPKSSPQDGIFAPATAPSNDKPEPPKFSFASPATTSPFTASSDKPASPNFSFATAPTAAPAASSDDKPAPKFSFASSAAPAASDEKPAPPSLSFTSQAGKDSEAKQTSGASFGSFGKPAEGATQSSAPPSFARDTPKTTSVPPSHTDHAPPAKPGNTPSFSFTPNKESAASARRGSGSDNFNRPAHPSPLAQSFTAGSEATDVGKTTSQTASIASAAPAAPSNKNNFTQTAHAKQSIAPKKTAPEPDFATIIKELARDVTLFPQTGLLDQYVEHFVGQVITDVQESLYLERINAQADEYRLGVLSHRYGKYWRELCRHRRLIRQGKERRRRTQRRLLESRSQASETASMTGSESVLGRSYAGSALGSRMSRQEEVDQMFQTSASNGRWSRLARQEEQARGGSKRPTSSQSVESMTGSRETGHKRLKSASHVDDGGRITKPAPTSHPSTSALKRSSFRETLPDSAPMVSTTKSNYFRLKALGRAHVYDLAPTYPRKRQHTDDTQSPGPAAQHRSSEDPSSQQGSPPGTSTVPRSRQASVSSVKSRKTTDDDDAILARARAAREALRDGGSVFQPETERPDPFRLSTGSQAVYESPSLERARQDARWRASQAGTDFGSSRRSDVPAYRLRESKFVPREQYGKAIERAKEFRASRSGESSRPESRLDMQTPSQPIHTASAQTAFKDPSPFRVPDQPASAYTRQQQHWPTAAPSQLSSGITPFDSTPLDAPAFQSTSFSTPTFGLDQAQTSAFGNHTLNSTEHSGPHDFSIQSSQTFQGTQNFSQAASPYQSGFAQHLLPEQDGPVQPTANAEPTNVDDSDDELQITNVTTPYMNGTSAGHTSTGEQSVQLSEDEEEFDEEDNDMGQSFGQANPYAALANGFDEEEEDGHFDDDAGHVGSYPGAVPLGEYSDEEGDMEDEDEEEFDDEEEDEFDEDEEDEEEDDGGQYLDPRMLAGQQQQQKPAADSAFAAQDEVIELSD